MERWHYLLVLAACVAVTLPLELVLGARVYRRPWLLTRTLLPVVVVFVTWDLLAHARGHWWFDDGRTLGPRMFGLPLEEWLFFLVVPVCALLTYEAVGKVLERVRTARTPEPAEAGHG
jgi:lycopene beta-cyclase